MAPRSLLGQDVASREFDLGQVWAPQYSYGLVSDKRMKISSKFTVLVGVQIQTKDQTEQHSSGLQYTSVMKFNCNCQISYF